MAEYKDGSELRQTPEDVSLRDPQRSAFYDVLKDEVLRFSLVGGGFLLKDRFTVDLSDGHFEVNGTPFFMYDSTEPLKNMKLVFHRRHTHQINSASLKELSHVTEYCVGWKAEKENGETLERILTVK